MDKKVLAILKKVHKDENVEAVQKKLQLSAIDDLRRANEIEGVDQSAFREVQDADSAANDFEIALDNALSAKTGFIPAYEYINENYSALGYSITELQSAVDNYARLASELGLDPDDNDEYLLGKDNLENLEELSLMVDRLIDRYEGLYEIANNLRG